MEPEAFRGVFEELKPKLLRYCTYRCGDPDTAEDVVQEAMVRLWQRDAGAPPADPASWLFTTARHLIQDGAKVARTAAGCSRPIPLTSPDRSGPTRPWSATKRGKRVRKVLSRMPERSREILMLRYSGFSYREIAGEVGVAPGSVGTLLARAERRFLALLGPSDEDAGR